MNPARALLLPPQAELAGRLAQAIVDRHRAALPDLSHVTVLLPGAGAAPFLRRRLGEQAGVALLGPRLLTLQQLAIERGAAPAPLAPADCRLILVDALRRYRSPFAGQSPWLLAEALFTLFEELELNAVQLPEQEEAFAATLRSAYGARPLEALSREAQIVHTLWRAFQEQTQGRSPAAVYATALRAAFAGMSAGEAVYLAGFDTLCGAERSALAAALPGVGVEIWLHGRGDGRDGAAVRELCRLLGCEPQAVEAQHGPEDARSGFLDAVFAAAPAAGNEVEALPGLRISRADDPEHEARCVDLAVRQALLDGCTEVAVVTQDRRLARRLRALLERAGVELQDQGGWALSTSAAAAALHAWLDSFERRFQFRPLLALLKSGFFDAEPQALRTLERDLVFGAGLESGLERFLARAAAHPALHALLERLQRAAQALPSTGRPRLLRDWMAGVERSLQHLGLWQSFQDDEAGRRLLEVLAELDGAFGRWPQSADWREFRALLDRAVERATFVAPAASRDRRVRLLTLEQGALLRCDALILAGATQGQIPGPPPGEPFFNQSVRGELGLPNQAQRHTLGLARLRRVLQAAPRLHITYASEQPGEPAQLSPWIEALEARAGRLGLDLRDRLLPALAGSAVSEIATTRSTPAEPRHRPAPPAPAQRLPRELSATAHQRLIDCPYQFFVQSCLGLRAEQAPDEDPDRSDYGQRVHRILEAFIQRVNADLPEPFTAPVNAANREQAQARLHDIAAAVFAPDLHSRALAQVWAAEFEAAIPALLDWLVDRKTTAVQAEVRYRREFEDGISLSGSADRVETLADESLTLVDYKTGRTPRQADVETGEAVQLLHYALLDPRIAAVEYLPLREDQKPLRLDQELERLRQAVAGRLRHSLRALAQGAPMPALGDEDSCGRCDYRGLCRRGDWHEH